MCQAREKNPLAKKNLIFMWKFWIFYVRIRFVIGNLEKNQHFRTTYSFLGEIDVIIEDSFHCYFQFLYFSFMHRNFNHSGHKHHEDRNHPGTAAGKGGHTKSGKNRGRR
jgi:hypothetical protein